MITQEYLKECLEYNSETGVFIWKERPLRHFQKEADFKRWNTIYKGKMAGTKTKLGYLQIRLCYKSIKLHRIAWAFSYGKWPTKNIDHVNGLTSDNRLINLREATTRENKQNLRKATKNNKSGFLGVSKRKNRYEASIKNNNVYVYLGSFKTPEEAHEAYLKSKRELHPFGTL